MGRDNSDSYKEKNKPYVPCFKYSNIRGQQASTPEEVKKSLESNLKK